MQDRPPACGYTILRLGKSNLDLGPLHQRSDMHVVWRGDAAPVRLKWR